MTTLLLIMALLFIVLMAAPATTARQTPNGRKLKDGHKTKFTFALAPDICLWEKTLKPPGFDMGDPIDTTTMFNDAWETCAQQALAKLTNGSYKCAYDPNAYNTIITSLKAKEGSCTVTYRDGSTLDFFGGIKSFIPDEHVRGTMPTATVEFFATNWDNTNNVEQGPVLTSVSGT